MVKTHGLLEQLVTGITPLKALRDHTLFTAEECQQKMHLVWKGLEFLTKERY